MGCFANVRNWPEAFAKIHKKKYHAHQARIQVQLMVRCGFSTSFIRRYLHRFVLWWADIVRIWNYNEIIKWFCGASFDIKPAAFAAGLLMRRHIRESHNAIVQNWHDDVAGLAETAIVA